MNKSLIAICVITVSLIAGYVIGGFGGMLLCVFIPYGILTFLKETVGLQGLEALFTDLYKSIRNVK